MPKTLGVIQDMHNLATTRGDASMVLLALLVRVLVLIRHGIWAQVGNALAEADAAFAESFPPYLDPAATCNLSPVSCSPAPATPAAAATSGINVTITGSLSRSNSNNSINGSNTDTDTRTKRACLILLIHLLMAGVVYHTYAGDVTSASERLKRLHALIDAGALNSEGGGRSDGILEACTFSCISSRHTNLLLQIPFPDNRSIHIMTTHPRILYVLVYLLSAVAKRDAVGRKPRKAVFAKEGLSVLEREGWGDVLVSGVGSGCNGGEEEQEGRVEFGVTGRGREISCGYLFLYFR